MLITSIPNGSVTAQKRIGSYINLSAEAGSSKPLSMSTRCNYPVSAGIPVTKVITTTDSILRVCPEKASEFLTTPTGQTLGIRLGKFCLQQLLHLRPFRRDDTVVNRIPDVAIGQKHMIAQNTFFDSADSLDCFLRADIAGIRLELYAQTSQGFEGVLEQ
jgi:hypothetical protein